MIEIIIKNEKKNSICFRQFKNIQSADSKLLARQCREERSFLLYQGQLFNESIHNIFDPQNTSATYSHRQRGVNLPIFHESKDDSIKKKQKNIKNNLLYSLVFQCSYQYIKEFELGIQNYIHKLRMIKVPPLNARQR